MYKVVRNIFYPSILCTFQNYTHRTRSKWGLPHWRNTLNHMLKFSNILWTVSCSMLCTSLDIRIALPLPSSPTANTRKTNNSLWHVGYFTMRHTVCYITCHCFNWTRYLLPVITNKVGISDTISAIYTSRRRHCPHCCATRNKWNDNIVRFHSMKFPIPRWKAEYSRKVWHPTAFAPRSMMIYIASPSLIPSATPNVEQTVLVSWLRPSDSH